MSGALSIVALALRPRVQAPAGYGFVRNASGGFVLNQSGGRLLAEGR